MSKFWSLLPQGLLVGLAIELITLFSRFGLGLQSTRDTRFLAAYTFGYRIHHGYLGLVLLAIALLYLHRQGQGEPRWISWLAVLGIALIVSDLIHHFLVLWPMTGDHQFDFVYPP